MQVWLNGTSLGLPLCKLLRTNHVACGHVSPLSHFPSLRCSTLTQCVADAKQLKFSGKKRRMKLIELCIERFPEHPERTLASFILQGKVLVEDRPQCNAGGLVPSTAELRIKGLPSRFASRAGFKLDAALTHFDIEVTGCNALDAGLSTGGFTDCLLQRGAAAVVGVDVGTSLVVESLRNDPRVVIMEGYNLRHLRPADLPWLPQLVTLDLSFISLLTVLPAVATFMPPGSKLVSLIKPQFEARRDQVKTGGIVSDAAVHRDVIARISAGVQQAGFTSHGVFESPVRGAVGKNKEFFLYASRN